MTLADQGTQPGTDLPDSDSQTRSLQALAPGLPAPRQETESQPTLHGECLLPTPDPVRTQQEGGHLQATKESSEETNCAHTLFLDFLPPEL